MKKIFTMLCGSLVLFLIFAAPGNSVQAEEHSCSCETTEISGAEKNKIIANLLKSDELKNARKGLVEVGFKWNGVSGVEVVYNKTYETMMIGLPISYNDGELWTAVFLMDY
jgi:hypothetical protein